MVCVVNLVSPDGRYDSTFLDNYGQIYVADVLKRIPGVSDVNVLRPQVCDADLARPGPPGRTADRADGGDRGDPAGEPPGRRRQDRRPAGPAGAGLRVSRSPSRGGWRRSPSSRRSSSAAATTARSSGSRTSPASSSTRRTTRRPASSTASRPARMPVYQYADANALDIVDQVRDEMDRLAKKLPAGARVPHRLRHDQVRAARTSARSSTRCVEAFVLVHDRRLRLPAGRSGRRSSRCWRSRSRWSRPSR